MMRFLREWAIPNSETFSIPPIRCLLKRYIEPGMVVIDPFARNSKIGTITNDLNPETTAQHHLDACDFLDLMIDKGVRAEVVLFDPPYSPRQISEAYKIVGMPVGTETTQNSRFCREVKTRLDQLLVWGGRAICLCWNSNGMNQGRMYRLEEVLTVCHGEGHNDTLVTVERKMQAGLFQ